MPISLLPFDRGNVKNINRELSLINTSFYFLNVYFKETL